MKRRFFMLIAAMVASVGLIFTVTTPAQAFSTITYTMNCPGTPKFQQMIVNNNNSGAQITVWAVSRNYWGYVKNGTTAWYSGLYYRDTVTYEFTGNGNLNWYYHVDCFY